MQNNIGLDFDNLKRHRFELCLKKIKNKKIKMKRCRFLFYRDETMSFWQWGSPKRGTLVLVVGKLGRKNEKMKKN